MTYEVIKFTYTEEKLGINIAVDRYIYRLYNKRVSIGLSRGIKSKVLTPAML